jgi:hypothetical protein
MVPSIATTRSGQSATRLLHATLASMAVRLFRVLPFPHPTRGRHRCRHQNHPLYLPARELHRRIWYVNDFVVPFPSHLQIRLFRVRVRCPRSAN